MTINHNRIIEVSTLLLSAGMLLLTLLTSTSINAQTFVEVRQTPGIQTFTVPAGVIQVTVEAWGGGGAGGGANNGRGGGGGGGAYVRSILSVVPNTTYSLYVAPSKSSTLLSTAIENNGNPSWFDNESRLIAMGGRGGSPASYSNGSGGAGSVNGSLGAVVFTGGSGTSGVDGGTGGGGAGSTGNGGNGTINTGGAGTTLFGGSGGGVASNNSPGIAGVNYGGGGSGAQSNNINHQNPGGAGAQGMIRITYTVPVPLAATATTTPSCQGVNPGTGTITVSASGGTAPYQYRLGSAAYQSSNTFTAVQPGNYVITVMDFAGTIFTIPNIVVGVQSTTFAPLTANVTDAGCSLPNGAITITNIPTALQFNKANSTYVDLQRSLLNNLSQFTLEGWIKIDKSLITGERTWGLFGQNDAIEFGILNSTTIQLWTVGGGSVSIPMSNYPNDNQWHHIAGVGTGTNLLVYIDGVPVTGSGTSVATSNYGSSAFNSMIGGNIWDATGNFLEGSILKTGFWNRALSASEIVNLATNPFIQYTTAQSGLIAGYNYFEGAGNSLNMIGSNPVSGTLVNSPQWTEVFTYSWIKTGEPTYSASTKNISSVSAGVYTLTAGFSGLCPVIGTWAVNNTGINLWTGAVSNDWNNNSNWTCAIPDITLDANIPNGLSRYPILSAGAVGAAKNLVISAGASVIVSSNTLQIGGSIQNSGSFDVTQGTLELRGTTAQIIPAASFTGNTIKNLTINNPNGVTLNGTLLISGILKAANGTFQSNDFLTLLSTSTQTALIDGSGAGTVNGSVAIQRYLPSAFGYKYFSSPFINSTVAQYSQELNLSASFASIYYYNENLSSTGWQPYTNASGILQPGTGYALNFGASDSPLTVSVTGTVNNGIIGPFTLYNNDRPYTRGFNLVGNPYPSPIDWDAAGWTKTNIDNALYFFNAASTDPYLGTYSTYINGISSDGIASNIIAAQQGFFVHVSDGDYPVQGTLTFTNSVRISNTNPVFHKNTATEKQPLIRLRATGSGSTKADYLVLYFNELASYSFNQEMDALKLKNSDNQVPDLYIISNEGKELSIKAIPEPFDTHVIHLGFSSKVNGTVTIKAQDLVNIPTGYHIHLKDNYTGQIQNLSVSNEYSFTSNNQTINDRFMIIISREDLSKTAFADDSFSVYTENKILMLKLTISDPKTIVQVIDLAGRILINKGISSEGEWALGYVNGAQVYVVRIITENGIFSKKVYVD